VYNNYISSSTYSVDCFTYNSGIGLFWKRRIVRGFSGSRGVPEFSVKPIWQRRTDVERWRHSLA